MTFLCSTWRGGDSIAGKTRAAGGQLHSSVAGRWPSEGNLQASSQAAKQPSSQAASDAELPGRGLRTAHASGSALLPRHISALSTCHRDSSKDALAQAAVDIRMSAAERLKQQPITCGEQRCKAPLCLHRGIPRHVQRHAAWSFSVQIGVKLKTAVAPGRQQERC